MEELWGVLNLKSLNLARAGGFRHIELHVDSYAGAGNRKAFVL
jgi:hypothetical protein